LGFILFFSFGSGQTLTHRYHGSPNERDELPLTPVPAMSYHGPIGDQTPAED